jgi:hypothetical protein
MRYAERTTAAFSAGSEDRIKTRSFGALGVVPRDSNVGFGDRPCAADPRSTTRRRQRCG